MICECSDYLALLRSHRPARQPTPADNSTLGFALHRDCENNLISGSLPTELGKLTALEDL